jgi:type IV fimbrial biogenesis protein FimT
MRIQANQAMCAATAGAGRGFTMIEILVVVAIIAILAAVAAPFFNDTLARNQVTSAAGALRASLDLARAEAVRRGRNVVVCQTTSPGAAEPACGSGSSVNWSSGWVTWVDVDGDGKVGTGEEILQRENPAADGSHTAQVVAGTGAVGFTADGLTTGSGTQNFCLSWRKTGDATAGTFPRCLSLARAGQITVTGAACSTPSC